MINKNFHDANIQGFFYNEKNNKLIIQIELSNRQKIALEFIQVAGWDFSPFEMQNVLFDIQEFNSTNFPEWLRRDFKIPKEYVNLILSGDKKVFYLEPSVGLGGYIVAKENQIDR